MRCFVDDIGASIIKGMKVVFVVIGDTLLPFSNRDVDTAAENLPPCCTPAGRRCGRRGHPCCLIPTTMYFSSGEYPETCSAFSNQSFLEDGLVGDGAICCLNSFGV